MISSDQLSKQFARFLEAETIVVESNGRLSIATPAEYPDCDGVTVIVDAGPGDEYLLSDMGAADARLVGRFGPTATANKGQLIAERFDVEFAGGSMVTTANEQGLAEACWRLAQASAALAEGASFQPLERLVDRSFADQVGSALDATAKQVKRNEQIEGQSGHAHTASFFVPATEAVVEPVSGRKAWAAAQGVYTEFGDLGKVNGFQLVAVVDDRLDNSAQLADLLGQVGQVAMWSRRDEWMHAVTSRDQ